MASNHQHVAVSELLIQDVPLVAAVVVLGPRRRDVGVDLCGVHAGLDELAALDMGVAAGVAGLLVPAGADVAVGGHIRILPFFARVSQERNVSIFASGENRAFSASSSWTLSPATEMAEFAPKSATLASGRPTAAACRGTGIPERSTSPFSSVKGGEIMYHCGVVTVYHLPDDRR